MSALQPNLRGWKWPLGTRRQLPARLRLSVSPQDAVALPSAAELPAEIVPDVVDQANLGSCTCNAACEAIESLRIKHGLPRELFSRLKLYYDTRVRIEQEAPDDDSGCLNSDVMQAVKTCGVAPEALWPYDIAKFAEAPSAEADAAALQHRGLLAFHCPTELEIKASIALGFAVVIGFVAFASLMSEETARTGVIPMPTIGDRPNGGHAVTIVAYDDAKHRFKILNSWGRSWGEGGFGWLPYDYWEAWPIAGQSVPVPLASDAITYRVVP